MKQSDRAIIKRNFWNPSYNISDSNLYADQIGWQKVDYAPLHVTDTYAIYHYYFKHLPFNLILYLPEKDKFYLFDMQQGGVFILRDRTDWDGKYISERADFDEMCWEDNESIFDFDNWLQP